MGDTFKDLVKKYEIFRKDEIWDFIKKSKKIITYDGAKRTPNVYASAILIIAKNIDLISSDDYIFDHDWVEQLVKDNFPVRVSDVSTIPEMDEVFIYDIPQYPISGTKLLEPADQLRMDGKTPYTSYGLLWKYLGAGIVGEKASEVMDEAFVCHVDEYSAGIESKLTSMFNVFNNYCSLVCKKGVDRHSEEYSRSYNTEAYEDILIMVTQGEIDMIRRFWQYFST